MSSKTCLYLHNPRIPHEMIDVHLSDWPLDDEKTASERRSVHDLRVIDSNKLAEVGRCHVNVE